MHIKFEEELQRIIARRADELSMQESGTKEDGVTDWLKAENEIMHELDSRADKLFENIDTQFTC